MAAAQQKFRRDREYREEQFLQRQTEIYRRLPRVEEIDRELRATVAQIMLSAFDNDISGLIFTS